MVGVVAPERPYFSGARASPARSPSPPSLPRPGARKARQPPAAPPLLRVSVDRGAPGDGPPGGGEPRRRAPPPPRVPRPPRGRRPAAWMSPDEGHPAPPGSARAGRGPGWRRPRRPGGAPRSRPRSAPAGGRSPGAGTPPARPAAPPGSVPPGDDAVGRARTSDLPLTRRALSLPEPRRRGARTVPARGRSRTG